MVLWEILDEARQHRSSHVVARERLVAGADQVVEVGKSKRTVVLLRSNANVSPDLRQSNGLVRNRDYFGNTDSFMEPQFTRMRVLRDLSGFRLVNANRDRGDCQMNGLHQFRSVRLVEVLSDLGEPGDHLQRFRDRLEIAVAMTYLILQC